MGVFRLEISPNKRAGCKNKECLEKQTKIEKGELRYATQVTIHEHTSWTYKHWGCVTPVQIEHLIEACGGDTDMVDGYDELPQDAQEKVKFALANGHVPDEDWRGDVEVNRPGRKGFRAKVVKKKQAKKANQNGEDGEDDEGGEGGEAAPKPKAKRARPAKDEDAEDAPAAKKPRGQGKKAPPKNYGVDGEAKAHTEAETEPEPTKAKSKDKKAAVKAEDAGEGDEGDKPKPNKGRASKATTKKEYPQSTQVREKRSTATSVAYDHDVTDPEADASSDAKGEAPKSKPSRKKSTAVPQKRTKKKKKAAAADE